MTIEGFIRLNPPPNLMRELIIHLFKETGYNYHNRGVAELELHQSNDVHAFYRLFKNPSKVIHIQGYPGLSSTYKAIVLARMMDYGRMMEIRNIEKVSIGNEHKAVIQLFPNFGRKMMVLPYNPKVLEKRLAENVPELR